MREITSNHWKQWMQFLQRSVIVAFLLPAAGATAYTTHDSSLIPFVANLGQSPFGILFSVKVPGGNAFVTDSGAISYRIGNATFSERFVTGKGWSAQGIQPSDTVVNIYSQGRSLVGIPTYSSVAMGEVADGIALQLVATKGTFEKRFFVAPGARPEQIKASVEGAQAIEIIDGQLVVHTGRGTVCFTAPVAWQDAGDERTIVPVAYTATGTSYGFRVSDFDRTRPLTIDPLLTGLFIGGTGSDEAIAMAVADNGDIIVAGPTSSSDFPVTDGSAYAGSSSMPDCVVLRYDPSATLLKVATFFGGSRSECSSSGTDDDWSNLSRIYFTGLTTIDHSVFLGGTTYSPDLPGTGGSYDTTCGTDGTCNSGQPDAFIARFNEQLVLEAATYFGGSSGDRGRALAREGDNIVVVGDSRSADLAPGVTFAGGDYDAFAALFSSDLKTLNAARMVGGNNRDRAVAVSANANGIYMTGNTGSADFPVTANAYDRTLVSGGYGDAFVVKLNGTSLEVEAATLLGGNWSDYAYSLAAHSSGSVHVAGATYGQADDGFPVTEAAYRKTAGTHDGTSNWRSEGFIARLSKDLDALEACTYLGGTDQDDIRGIAEAPNGDIVVAGFTKSPDFPVTEGALDTAQGGDWDGFLSVLSADLSTLRASTLVGGAGEDRLFAVVLDAFGNPAAVGFSTSTDIPGMAGVGNGSKDVVLLRISPELASSPDAAVSTASPPFIDFGGVDVSASSVPVVVRLHNIGAKALAVTSIAVDDASTFQLALSGGPACSNAHVLAPGTYCEFVVSMTPQIAGTINGEILVSTGDPATDLAIELTGLGIGAEVEASPEGLDDAADVEGAEEAPVAEDVGEFMDAPDVPDVSEMESADQGDAGGPGDDSFAPDDVGSDDEPTEAGPEEIAFPETGADTDTEVQAELPDASRDDARVSPEAEDGIDDADTVPLIVEDVQAGPAKGSGGCSSGQRGTGWLPLLIGCGLLGLRARRRDGSVPG